MIPVASSSPYCTLAPPNPILFPPRHPFRIPGCRVYRRRRPKPIPSRHVSAVLNHLPLPSVLSLASISVASLSAAVLAVSAYYNDRRRGSDKKKEEAYGKKSFECILHSSPTPFNRFVFCRCPSLSFPDGTDEKLVTEDHHFVWVHSGVVRWLDEDEEEEDDDDELEYQRVCVGTQDGGVLSIDWPESLDLTEERALDTTVVVIPGTTEGSMDARVRGFVKEALRHGFFPVVVNPRGCASSPITTARLFTAADSDDISTAIQFISKARPWTTLMAVGWGFGANVLTKYLAEVGERTPLTAAICVNNPFDLEEATRSSPHDVAIDEELADGLVDMLRANKELFRGKTKGFDVEKALVAKSVREFEQAISMVSYGFDAIEDFYSMSSTRDLVGYVKIPVLFIQSNDGTVPMFSIPRHSIAENPYTSLLLSSSFPSGFAAYKQSALSWFRNLIIEWLMAVELGLLKGRHPLLKDVDVTINPVKGLHFLESRGSNRHNKSNKLLELTTVNSEEILQNAVAAGNTLRNSQSKRRKLEDENGGLPKEMDESVLQTGSLDADLVEEEISASDERGQVLQSAQLVMNMLDATMPGTLTEDKKQKVLSAVSQGETLMKALQDAVPDDVRDKLTTAVSVIVKTQGSNLKLDGILDMSTIPKLSCKLKPKNLKNDNEASGTHSSEQHGQNSENLDAPDGSSNNKMPKDNTARAVESEPQAVEKLVRDYGDDVSKNSNDAGSTEYLLEKPVQDINQTGGKSERSVDDARSDDVDFSGSKVCDSLKTEEKSEDNLTEQSKITLGNKEDEPQSSPGTLSEMQQVGKSSDDNLRKENKGLLTVMDHANSKFSDVDTPTFSVSQALDALTGMDDSTQVAVNSVFGVLEEMITQLGEASDDGNKGGNEVNNKEVQSPSRLNSNTVEKNLGNQGSGSKKLDLPDNQEITSGPQNYGNNKERSQPSTDGAASSKAGDLTLQKNQKNVQLVNRKILSRDITDGNCVPTCRTTFPYQNFIRNAYMQRYLLSLMRDQMRQNISKGCALPLDYHPEEGQWKLMGEPKSDVHSGRNIIGKDTGRSYQYCSHPETDRNDGIIEPSYIIVDYEKPQDPAEESIIMDKADKTKGPSYSGSDEMVQFVKKTIHDCLEVEVGRRCSIEDLEEVWPSLAGDFELVSGAVCAVVDQEKISLNTEGKYYQTYLESRKICDLPGERVISAISDAVQGTVCLKKILPIGVIVGFCLAALRKHFHVVTTNESADFDVKDASLAEVDDLGPSVSQPGKCIDKDSNDNSKAVVGVVAAALGTSALLAQQQVSNSGDYSAKSSFQSSLGGGPATKEPVKLDEISSEKDPSNIVVSLAEKAMSVAAPVVPTKEDGELDQEKLVALLADLGQKGGMLKLVGKLALLWGGLRGAMSLTDKLISFLRIAERPLIQRMIAFVAMVLVLWSPVVVPLLPTLVQSWMSNGSPRFAELACVIGVYIALTILIMLWGKRIRGYEKPLQQYGLDLTSPGKVRDFLKGFVVGAMLVYSVQYANSLMGFVRFSQPPSLYSPSLDSIVMLKVFGKVVVSVGRAFATATSVALVEELLFRSWLPEEISADLGYHQGIIWSGLAYSLFQRNPWAMPGLWLLSFGLAGLRHRNSGSLSSPIGVHTGIMVTSFMLQAGGFLTYNPNLPLWMTGTHPFQPFSGVVGLAFSLVFAILLYPRNSVYKKDGIANEAAS